jgi:hypothetical protein
MPAGGRPLQPKSRRIDAIGARIVARGAYRPAMDVGRCELCGEPIVPGEAWLKAQDGPPAIAHAGCVYREEPTAEPHRAWSADEG